MRMSWLGCRPVRLSCRIVRLRGGVIGCLLLSGWATAAQAQQPPELNRVFPPGATRGQTTSVQVKGTYAADSVAVWCSDPELTWQKTETEHLFSVTIPESSFPGPVWIRLTDSHGASEVKPFVIGHLPEALEVEPNDRTDQAQLVDRTPVVIQGVLQTRGDVDHYRVAVRKGATLVACVDAQRFLQSPVDTTLQLVTVDGHLLQQNLDHRGLDPQVVWTAPADMEVVVRVFGFPSQPDSTITLGGGEDFLYRLTVTTAGFVEAVVPAVSGAQSLERVRLHGWNLAAEQQVEAVDGSGDSVDSRPLFWPLTVGVFPRPPLIAPHWLAEDLVEVWPNTRPAARESTVEPPFLISGRLTENRQVDEFLVQVTKDEVWEIELQAAQLGYPWDPVLEVRSIDGGQRLQRVDDTDGPDPKLVWQAPSSDVHRIVVYDLHGHAGQQQWYRLSMLPVVPDFAVTVDQSRFSAQLGGTVEIPLRIERRHGFAAVLEFELQLGADPPTAIQWTKIRSEADGDSAKQLTWSLAAREPFNGPIRVLARVVDGMPPREEIVEHRIGLSDVWLTIQPASAP